MVYYGKYKANIKHNKNYSKIYVFLNYASLYKRGNNKNKFEEYIIKKFIKNSTIFLFHFPFPFIDFIFLKYIYTYPGGLPFPTRTS